MAIRNLILHLVGIGILVGCGQPLGQSTEPVRCDIPNLSAETSASRQRGDTLFLTTADHQYFSGFVRELDLVSGKLSPLFFPVSGDAIVRATQSGDVLYVLNRYKAGDNLRIIKRADYSLICEVSLGRGTNPKDIVLKNGFAYVSRAGSQSLLKLRLDEPTVVDEIDLSGFDSSDRKPEMSWMSLQGDHLWVILQKLDTKQKFFPPAGKGSVVVIDTNTDEIIKTYPLTDENPDTDFRWTPDGRALVAAVGAWGQTDGAIISIDKTFRLSEKELGGDVLDFAVVGNNRAVAVVVTREGKTQLVQFDPSDAEANTKIVLTQDGGAYRSFTKVNYLPTTSELVLGDRQLQQASLLFLNADTYKEVRRVDVGLPPYHMVIGP